MPSNPSVYVGAGRYTLPASGVIIPLAAYNSAAVTSAAFSPLGATALQVVFFLTAITGTSLTIKVQAYDQGSGVWYDFKDAAQANQAISAAITTASSTVPAAVLTIDPREVSVANKVFQSPVPDRLRLVTTYTAITAATYSATAIAVP